MRTQPNSLNLRSSGAVCLILVYGFIHAACQVPTSLQGDSKETMKKYQHQPHLQRLSESRKKNSSWILCPMKCTCLENESHVITSVDCSGIGLTKVPALPSTTVTLDLQRNSISNITCEAFDAVSLESLNLGHNPIKALPHCLFRAQAKSLKHLYASDCYLQILDSVLFRGLTVLNRLDLSHNYLDTLKPGVFSHLVNLDYLDLSSSRVQWLSGDTFQGLNKLRTLFLNNNLLRYEGDFPPNVFRDLPSLEVLNIKGSGGAILASAVLYYNRWKLRYLYYIGQRRMHIGNTPINYRPESQTYIIYDEDEPKWRRFLQQDFLPRLRHENIDYILGEVNFPSGDLMSSIAGAVVGTNKTLVLLSEDIFIDHYREIGVNLGIMKEINTRSQVLVPVWLERVDLATYPAEIESFLQHQEFRCLAYEDNDMFWQQLLNAVNENT